MGQDYVARKQAKKQRKRQTRDAETGRKTKKRRKEEGFDIAGEDDGLQVSAEAQKRKRKKGNNVPLRISRSLCYKEPALTAEDIAWDGSWEDGDGEEQQDRGRSTVAVRAMDGLKESGYDSDVEEQLSRLTPAQQKQLHKPTNPQQQQKQKQQDRQKPKLSSGISLLDPVKAAKESQQRNTQQQRRQQQQLEDVIAANPDLQALSTEVHPLIARCMAKLGFYEPTPVQSATWPAAAAGKDVQGIAEPGSGKTLAYLLPALVQLAAGTTTAATSQTAPPAATNHPADTSSGNLVQPQVLILAPSRELAQQVYHNCKSLFSVTAASTCCVFGGAPKDEQITKLQQRQPAVLVATPGRLLDLMDSQVLGLQHVRVVVLDEADKMLSVGFEPQLQRLKGLLLDNRAAPAQQQRQQEEQVKGKSRKKQKHDHNAAGTATAAAGGVRPQVLLFTATFPAAVQSTADAWLQPGAVHVTCRAGADSISRSITQVVHVCAEPKKPAKLLKHLAAIKEAAAGLRNPPRVLVFANKIKTVVFVHKTLTEAGYRAVMLHGKRSQQERTAAVTDFKSGKAQVLVASDVASRGLDIRGLPYVVNYDFPSNLNTYIHRVGRTGRLAAQGHSYSFFTRPMAKLAGPVAELLQQHDQAIDPNLLQLAEAWRQVEAALAAQGKALPDTATIAAHAAGDGDDEEQEAPAAAAGDNSTISAVEDLQEGLPAITRQQQQQQQELISVNKKKRKQQAGDVFMVPQAAAAAAAAVVHGATGSNGTAATTPAATIAVPDFLPSKAFVGAKPGMVFQNGSRGQGYYPDSAPAAAAAAAAEKQRQQQLQRLALQKVQKQQAKKQQQPTGVKQQQKQQRMKQQQQQQQKPSDGLPLLPGLARKQRQQQQFYASNLSDDDGGGALDRQHDSSSDDDDDEQQQKGASFANRLQAKSGGRRKALPGRLRKKVAKQKAKQAAA